MSANPVKTVPPYVGWRFTGLFALYSGILLLILQRSPLSVIETVAEATASATVFFWNLFAVPFTGSGLFIRLHDFLMEVTLECTGAHYIALVMAGVLAAPDRSFRQKLSGLAALTACIAALNILRIGMLGIIGHSANRFFHMVHGFVWQGLFALASIFLWAVWVRGNRAFSHLLRLLGVGLLTAAASFWLIRLALPSYTAVLAAATDLAGRALWQADAFPAETRAVGNSLAYLVPGGWARNDMTADILNSTVFFTLLRVTVPLADVRLFMQRLAAGTILLFVCHAGLAALWGSICAQGIGENVYGDLLRGASFLAPPLVWLVVAQLCRQGKGLQS